MPFALQMPPHFAEVTLSRSSPPCVCRPERSLIIACDNQAQSKDPYPAGNPYDLTLAFFSTLTTCMRPDFLSPNASLDTRNPSSVAPLPKKSRYPRVAQASAIRIRSPRPKTQDLTSYFCLTSPCHPERSSSISESKPKDLALPCHRVPSHPLLSSRAEQWSSRSDEHA